MSVGVTLAFNTIGWDAQNFLFNTVDAIAGDCSGNQICIDDQALYSEHNDQCGGHCFRNGDSEARIDARVANSSTAIGVVPGGAATNVAIGAVLAVNKVATDVDATINGATTMNAGGDVTVTAKITQRSHRILESARLRFRSAAGEPSRCQ